MKDLEVIKDQYAKDEGYDDFMHCLRCQNEDATKEIINEIAEAYTKEQVKAKLQEAAEKIENRASPVNGIIHEHKLTLKSIILSLIKE